MCGGLLGRRCEVSGGAAKRASVPPALPFPSSFFLSSLLPHSLPLCVFGLAHRGCCRGALRTGNEPFSPLTNTEGEVEASMKLWLVNSTDAFSRVENLILTIT